MKKTKNQEMKKEEIFIIMPGYNEEKHIEQVIKRIKKEGFENIVFIDDGSRDKSSEIALKNGAIVLRHIVNLGKGAASNTGCEYAIKNDAKILVLIDSDGQHKPEDISKFISSIKDTDIVFGYRKMNKHMPFVMRFGNQVINLFSRIINGINLNDTQSGFRAMTSNTYKKIRWTATDYSMESEMVANVSRHKIKYAQIPIETIYHDSHKGTTVIDGLKIFINIIKFRFRKYN